MHQENKSWFLRGMRDGLPIGLGYMAVAFTLGIAARNAGLTAFQATLASLLNNASAGEYAGFKVIQENAGYLAMVAMIFVANARYLLMSCALSQKLAPETGLIHRLLVGFEVTDEVFGINIAVQGMLCPWYTYGAMTMAVPGWAIGTCLGVIMGNALPANVVSALSVGLFGMFIAIIVPPMRKNKVIAVLVPLSMLASFALSKLEPFASMASGVRVIILTVVLSAGAAILYPVKEEEEHAA